MTESVVEARMGCDLVLVAEVEESIRRYGDRYLRRVFTAAEIAETAGPDRGRRLAARFAAKEAVVKALRLGDELGPWTGVEILRAPGGGVAAHLRGGAGAAQEIGGLIDMDVSLSHAGDLAMATAVALIRVDGGTPTRPVSEPEEP